MYTLVFNAVTNPIDPNDVTATQKGDLVTILPPGFDVSLFSPAMINNNVFVRVDVGRAAIAAYRDTWHRGLQYSINSLDTAQDLWEVSVKANNAQLSGRGAITRAEVDNALAEFNVISKSISNRTVLADVRVADVATSPGFLRGVTQGVVFSPVSYNATSGEHVIAADYVGATFHPNKMSTHLDGIAVDIPLHDTAQRVIHYTVMRNDVLAAFRRYVRERLDAARVGKHRYALTSSQIDNIVTQGRFINTTLAQLQSAVVDKVSA